MISSIPLSTSFESVKIIDQAAVEHTRKGVYDKIDQVSQILQNQNTTLTQKVLLAGRGRQLKSNYQTTHTFVQRLFNFIATKLFHIHTDFDVIDGIHKIDKKLTFANLYKEAIDNNDEEALRALIKTVGPNDSASHLNHITPLMRAAYRGQVNLLKILIEEGLADPNFRGWARELRGESGVADIPLSLAIFSGSTESAHYLLDKGADPNGRPSNPSSLIDNDPPIRTALEKNNLEIFNRLLEMNTAVNVGSRFNTLLHMCAQCYHPPVEYSPASYIPGRMEALKALLNHGAHANAGKPPLFIRDESGLYPIDMVSHYVDRKQPILPQVAEIYFSLLEVGPVRNKEFAFDCMKSPLVTDENKARYREILLARTNWITH